MKKLRLLVGLSGPAFSLSPNDEHEFEDAEAARLVKAGFAEEVKAEKAPAKK